MSIENLFKERYNLELTIPEVLQKKLTSYHSPEILEKNARFIFFKLLYSDHNLLSQICLKLSPFFLKILSDLEPHFREYIPYINFYDLKFEPKAVNYARYNNEIIFYDPLFFLDNETSDDSKLFVLSHELAHYFHEKFLSFYSMHLLQQTDSLVSSFYDKALSNIYLIEGFAQFFGNIIFKKIQNKEISGEYKQSRCFSNQDLLFKDSLGILDLECLINDPYELGAIILDTVYQQQGMEKIFEILKQNSNLFELLDEFKKNIDSNSPYFFLHKQIIQKLEIIKHNYDSFSFFSIPSNLQTDLKQLLFKVDFAVKNIIKKGEKPKLFLYELPPQIIEILKKSRLDFYFFTMDSSFQISLDPNYIFNYRKIYNDCNIIVSLSEIPFKEYPEESKFKTFYMGKNFSYKQQLIFSFKKIFDAYPINYENISNKDISNLEMLLKTEVFPSEIKAIASHSLGFYYLYKKHIDFAYFYFKKAVDLESTFIFPLIELSNPVFKEHTKKFNPSHLIEQRISKLLQKEDFLFYYALAYDHFSKKYGLL